MPTPQVDKAGAVEKKNFNAEETLPIVGAVVLIACVGHYLWRKKPWSKGDDAPASA